MTYSKILPKEIFQRREELGIKNSVNMLFKIIEKENDNKKRKSAIKFLGLINFNSNILKKESFEILENVLISDDNIELKCEAANSISFLGLDDALKPLKWILNQETIDNQLKISALKAISNIRFQDPEIKLFIKELDSNYQSVRECVVHQLIKVKPKRLTKLLLETLENESFSEKHKIEVLKLMGYTLSKTTVFDEATKTRKLIYPEVLPDLIRHKKTLLIIITSVLKDNLLESILKILGLISSEITDDLIKYANNDDYLIKTNAIKLLGKLRINEGVKALLENLDNMYEEVSKASIESLGEIGNIEAVPKLINVLNIEDHHFEYIDLDMKWFILDAISNIYKINKDVSYEYLYSLLESKNDILLESVAYLFGEIGVVEFLEPLIRLIGKRNIDVRKAAAIALGKIGNLKGLDPLISMVENDGNYWLLKKVAADAVYNVYFRNLCIESKSSESERFFIQRTEKLIGYLKQTEDHCKVKLSLIKLLEEFGGKTALNALISQLNDFHRIVRISSSKAIKKIEKRLEEEK